MRKLVKLKEWLTVPDAARQLAIAFGEEVSEADVLRLALDNHLVLSVLFVNSARGRFGPIVPLEEARRETIQISETETFTHLAGLLIRPNEVLELGAKIIKVDGVWDLPMLGAERLDVEHRYHALTGGPAVTSSILDGTIVSREDGTMCRLESLDERPRSPLGEGAQSPANEGAQSPANEGAQSDDDGVQSHDKGVLSGRDNTKKWDWTADPANYYPAGGLPSDAVFVVRASALRELERRVSEIDQPPEKPVGQRERNTLLAIIAALAEMARIDVTRPSKGASAIASQMARMGLRMGVRTIEEHLKRIPDALESRQED